MSFLPGNDIFGEDDIYYGKDDKKPDGYEDIDEESSEDLSSEEEVPEPRKYKEKSLKFTAKPFRGVAMRDHLPAKKAEL